MKRIVKHISFFLLLVSFHSGYAANYFVSTVAEINNITASLQPGDTVTMKNQVWMNANIVFSANGTAEDSIYLIAETPGYVRLSGTSNLRIGGSYVVVDGLYFINGYSPSGAVIEFRKTSSSEASNCRLTNTAIVDYNPPSNSTDYKWISLYGSNNRVDHCYLRGKKHAGTTLVVWLSALPNYHRIDNNYFAHRPPLGVNGGETIRVGTSDWSMYDSYTVVENNYFEECDGEAEIISNKSCENIYRYNTFAKCDGALTLRHGNRCSVYNNYFLGGKKSGTGGVRIIGEDHKVYNNYFFELTGSGIRAAISVMNGIPDSPLNGYWQVKNAVVAFNSFVNCSYNFNIGTGASTSQNLPPENCIIANNLVKGSVSPLIRYEAVPINIFYEGNIMYGAALGITPPPGIFISDPLISLSDDGIYRILGNSPAVDSAAGNYNYVMSDIDGQSRNGNKDIGADEFSADPVLNSPIKAGETGPAWLDVILAGPVVVKVSAGHNILLNAVAEAQPFSVIELSPGVYTNDTNILIDKNLIIKSSDGNNQKPVVQYTGSGANSIFTISGSAVVSFDRLELDGTSGVSSFVRYLVSSSGSSTGLYRFTAYNCSFKNSGDPDGSIFYAYPGTLADSIKFVNCLFTASRGNAVKMDEEDINSGRINVKSFEAVNCTFWNIDGTGISIYGGDESTLTAAPKIKINHCTFYNVGSNNKSILNFKDADGAEVVSSLLTNSNNNISVLLSGSASKIHYCDTFNVGPVILERGAVKGNGMMGVDPLFFNPEDGNFLLASNSPVLNRGYDFYSMGDLRWDPNLTSIRENSLPEAFILYQNYPNPFNPATRIVFNLKNGSVTKLFIYDIRGSLVETLIDCYMEEGRHEFTWTPAGLSSGVYFCRLISGDLESSVKMVYIK